MFKFLRRVFGREGSGRPPWFPQCQVYFCPKGIMVSAVQGDGSGRWSVDGDPMVLLPPEAANSKIGEAVISSLAASHDKLTALDAERQYSSTPSRFGVRNWSMVEKQWDLIRIATERGPEAVDIYPMNRYQTGGWIMEITDAKYHCRLNANEIGEIVSKIIRGPAPEIIADEPSHV